MTRRVLAPASFTLIPRLAVVNFVLVLAMALVAPSRSINLPALLAPYKDFSSFASLLASAPSLSRDLENRSTLTILAVPNAYLSSSLDLAHRISAPSLADVLRCHILLEYISWSELHRVPASGSVVTTLFQTTGRATYSSGSVNLTRDASSGVVTVASYASNATVLSLVGADPYNYTIVSVDSLLLPASMSLTTSDSVTPPVVNITRALIDGHDFNVAVSMLQASGVVDEFESDEGGAGITLFIPTDAAFANLPDWASLQSLPAYKKAVVLKFHVLHSYYPLGSLDSIVNPVQPTLATEDMGAGRFTLSISRVNGSVCVNSGVVQASVTQTVFDQNPISIFGVSNVLLPDEYFGKGAVTSPSVSNTANYSSTPVVHKAQPPESSMTPAASPALRNEFTSGDSCRTLRFDFSFIYCIFCTFLLLI